MQQLGELAWFPSTLARQADLQAMGDPLLSKGPFKGAGPRVFISLGFVLSY